jgi:carbonic anhydrase
MKKKMFVTLLSFIPFQAFANNEAHWEYAHDGLETEAWGEVCLHGKQHSPIDIDDQNTKQEKENLNIQYGSVGLQNSVNNGHTVQVNVKPGMKVLFGKKS